MIFETLDLIFKVVTLMFIAGIIQLSFGRRLWSLVIFAQAVWLLVFRASFLRAISLSLGLFGKSPQSVIHSLTSFLMGGVFGAFLDFLVLAGAVVVFAMLAENKTFKDPKWKNLTHGVNRGKLTK